MVSVSSQGVEGQDLGNRGVQEAGMKVPPVAASMMRRSAEQTPKIRMAQARTFFVGYLFTWMVVVAVVSCGQGRGSTGGWVMCIPGGR